MRTTFKTGLVIVVGIALLMGAVVAAARYYLMESYVELESAAARRTAHQLERAWSDELKQLATAAIDYAVWDDMYDFVARPNIPFVKSNFAYPSMTNFKVDTVLVLNAAKTPVFWRRFNDRETRGFAAANKFVGLLPSAVLDLGRAKSDTPLFSGLVATPDRLMAVVAYAIYPSLANAAPRGVLLFGRTFDEAALKRLAANMGRPVTAHTASDPALPEAVRHLQFGNDHRGVSVSLPVSDEDIRTYLALPNLDGQPALVIDVTEPREVYVRGLETIRYLVSAALLVCGIFGVIAFLLSARLAKNWAERQESEARYRAVVTQASEGIILVDVRTRRILEANQAFLESAGFDQKLPRELFLYEVFPPGAVNTRLIAQDLKPGLGTMEMQLRAVNGELLDVEVTTSIIIHQGRDVLCLVTRDVTARKAAELRLRASEKRLDHLAHHDGLTGLPNRLFLHSFLKRAMTEAEASGTSLAVFFLDVDRFKYINDSRGHETGDALLKELAARITAAVGDARLVVRMGGDEFVVVMPNVNDDKAPTQLAKRILDTLRAPFWYGNLQFLVTGSVGVSIFPRDAPDLSTLIRSADTAMYHAKEKGRNNYQFFRADLNTSLTDRVALEGRLRTAVSEGRFHLLYQPQIDLRLGAIIGVEALLRWRDESGELQSPASFIQVAEESGLIVEIGEWVLREAIRVRKHWQETLAREFPIAVNISPSQLRRPEFLSRLKTILRDSALSAHLLEMELTESAFMRHAAEEAASLHELRELGIGISVDDFGMGYSSLSYLKDFPITKLKIDRSFVRDMVQDANDAAIVRAILAMAQSMRIPVCAEGVETDEQLDFLVEHNCEYAQGFIFGQPMEADSLYRLLAGTTDGSVSMRLKVKSGGRSESL
jgi:diguanylate cyclase (GGDEF)-like protein/PAS domain S-box-containing protein